MLPAKVVLKERKERDKSEWVAIKNSHLTGYDVEPHNGMHNLFTFPSCLVSRFTQKL
jgi:hypothetical protein